jgi:hypothetical protein
MSKPFGFYGNTNLPHVEINHEVAITIIRSCVEEAGQSVFEKRLAGCFSSEEEFDDFMNAFIMEPKAAIQWAAQFLEDC